MAIIKLTPSCKDYLWGGSRLRTDFGVHVLQLVERRPAGRLPFDEVRDTLVQEVERALRNQARTELRDGILKEVTADDAAIANLVEPAPAQ